MSDIKRDTLFFFYGFIVFDFHTYRFFFFLIPELQLWTCNRTFRTGPATILEGGKEVTLLASYDYSIVVHAGAQNWGPHRQECQLLTIFY